MTIFSLFFEENEFYCEPDKLDSLEHGGVAIARGHKVIKLDSIAHEAFLQNGTKIKFEKVLIATG